MKKFKTKIMYNPKSISDEEINAYKNFDQLLKAKEDLMRKKNINHSLALGIILIASITLLYSNFIDSVQETDQANSKNISEINTKDSFIENNAPPIISDSIIQNDSQNSKTLEELTSKEANEEDKKANLIQKPKSDRKLNPNQTDEIVEFVDAHPVDGFPALYEYFEQEMRYPENALAEKIEGTVLAQFTVTVNGKIENVRIIKGVSPEIDQEAIRLFQEMPLWKAASYGNQKFNSNLTIPLTFQINN